jgi:hypothetical protein
VNERCRGRSLEQRNADQHQAEQRDPDEFGPDADVVDARSQANPKKVDQRDESNHPEG